MFGNYIAKLLKNNPEAVGISKGRPGLNCSIGNMKQAATITDYYTPTGASQPWVNAENPHQLRRLSKLGNEIVRNIKI